MNKEVYLIDLNARFRVCKMREGREIKTFCLLADPIFKHTKTKYFEIYLAVSIDSIKKWNNSHEFLPGISICKAKSKLGQMRWKGHNRRRENL